MINEERKSLLAKYAAGGSIGVCLRSLASKVKYKAIVTEEELDFVLETCVDLLLNKKEDFMKTMLTMQECKHEEWTYKSQCEERIFGWYPVYYRNCKNCAHEESFLEDEGNPDKVTPDWVIKYKKEINETSISN